MRQSPKPRSEPRRSTEPPHSTIGWNRLSTANRDVRLSASLASVVQSVEVAVSVQSSSLSSVRPANGKCPSVGSEVLGSVSNLAVRGEIPPVVRDSCPWLGSCRVVLSVPCATIGLLDFQLPVGSRVRSPETVLSFLGDPWLQLLVPLDSDCS